MDPQFFLLEGPFQSENPFVNLGAADSSFPYEMDHFSMGKGIILVHAVREKRESLDDPYLNSVLNKIELQAYVFLSEIHTLPEM